MEQFAYEASVPKDLADLIPDFMSNRKKDIVTLRVALEEANLEEVRAVGHRMRGIGSSYGFDPITALGKQMEDAAKAAGAGALASIATLLEAYEAYIANVQVTFV